MNSRQDLFPWFAYLFVKPNSRSLGIAQKLLAHGEEIARSIQFTTLYLESNHINFYERFVYKIMVETSDPFGERARIYIGNEHSIHCESLLHG